jgi:hypothetical protein
MGRLERIGRGRVWPSPAGPLDSVAPTPNATCQCQKVAFNATAARRSLTGRSWPVSVASVASPPYFFSGSCPDALDTVSPSCTASHKARPTRNLLGSAVGQADLQAAVHVRAVEQSAGLLYDDAFPAVIHLPRCSRRVFCADPPRVSPAGAFKLPGRSHALANPCRLQTSTVLSTAFPRSGSPPRTRTYEYRRSAR